MWPKTEGAPAGTVVSACLAVHIKETALVKLVLKDFVLQFAKRENPACLIQTVNII